MNKPATLPLEVSSLAPKCEHCGEPFAPRSTGGKAQRFCSTDCRRAHHDAEDQRAQRAGTCTLPAAIPEPEAQPEPEKRTSGHKKGTLLAGQPEIKFEWGSDGCLLIEQTDDYGNEDRIYIAAGNINAFLDAVCDICGVGGAP